MTNFTFKKMVQIAVIASLSLSPFVNAKTLVNVDGVDISDSIFAPLKQQNPNFNYDTLPDAQKTQLLDEIIGGVIMANAAKKEGLDKTEEFKMASLQLLSQLWLKKQVDSLSKTVSVTQAEAQTFYNNNKSMFITQNAEVRHILVQKEDQAKNLIVEIGKVPKTKTEEKITELAKKFSMDTASKDQGGLVQLPINNPAIPPEFAQEVKKMTAGTYTKAPVKTRYGYYIIYLKKLDAPVTQTFEQVKTQLIDLLKQQKMEGIVQEKLKKLRDTSKITYGN
ncbi:peptidylprolyl isomerase [Helicobacter didelphidarum]|uniref:Peptidylprolyl isomerase n=1 Tax=Helicobacter didelphidarum TaxID=2040648 RepID=A0A3D8IJB4_9HELI|nr:peptidyl-prolyl cis-trans isomerase [Helicobacter didelphidarum]RDU64976.1 peptidylprolyl isomerase [Helicobacter didelphidarum]